MPLKRAFRFPATTTSDNWLSPRIRVSAGRTLYLGTRGIASGMVVGTSRKPLNKRVYVKRHNVPLCRRSVRLFVLCFHRSTPCISQRYPLYTRTSRVANLSIEIMDTCTVMVKLCRQDSRPSRAAALAIYVLPNGHPQRDATRVARTLRTEYGTEARYEDFVNTPKRC